MKKKDFAENLKILRAENNMSQNDLAKRLGVTQQCVSEWELANTEPTLTYLCIMADVFEVSLDALCGRVNCKTRKIKFHIRVDFFTEYVILIIETG